MPLVETRLGRVRRAVMTAAHVECATRPIPSVWGNRRTADARRNVATQHRSLNRRRIPMAAFQTLLGLATCIDPLPTTGCMLRSLPDSHDVDYTPA
jgi:hypothetical protein